ncbi:hypothetical protein [Hydrogenophaga sp.]|uniref:hypothetical protein n=1 Tax=Hydrogenophaga sp. TaxID=1904254 RepID=UPI00262290C4|nr:hypothetical protein [Hydrogenophaga sp.]MCW5653199.1 hypothetical protein [Hydrogenophaga sp.]
MKQQIARLSPHQNGKVFAVLAALGTLVVIVPAFLIMLVSGSGRPQFPAFGLLLMPLFYLVVCYLMVSVGCIIYNFMFRYIGGVEFEARGQDAE